MEKVKSLKGVNFMRNILMILPLLFLITSCGLFQKREKPVVEKKVEQKVEDWTKSVEPQNVTIRPGEAVILKVAGNFPKEGELKCDKRKYLYFLRNNTLLTFLSESYFSKLKPYDCYFKSGDKNLKVASVSVKDKDFPSERLYVDKKRVFLNKKNAARAKKESKLRMKAYNSTAERPLFFDPFELPINSKVTSIYGSKRIFNKKKQTQHLGTDYRAAVGVPIRSANRGKVVISRDFFYTGNTIIIDHGLGIFTTYGHLSKREVSEGEIVPKGTVIGLAGKSGRVTGPHLHWGVTVNGLAIEGESLVEASKDLKEYRP